MYLLRNFVLLISENLSCDLYYTILCILFQLTTFLEANIGVKGMFMSFGFVCVLFAMVALRWVPETHGKLYRDVVSPKNWKINKTET